MTKTKHADTLGTSIITSFDDDYQWFKDRPKRLFRRREPWPDEIGVLVLHGKENSNVIVVFRFLVHRFAPAARWRYGLYRPGGVAEIADSDVAIEAELEAEHALLKGPLASGLKQ